MERNVFLDLFVKHGVSAEEARAMSDVDFMAALNSYLDEQAVSTPPPHSAQGGQFSPAFNNGLDEDEAVRQAIASSLQEEYLPQPARRPLAVNAILRPPVGARPALHSHGLARAVPESAPVTSTLVGRKPVPTFATFSESADPPGGSAALNIEFDDVLEDPPVKAEEERRRRETERRRRQDELAAKFRALPPEPRTGVALAVGMPNGSRIKRTFEPDVKGEIVYVWVAGSTIGWEKELELGDFELEIPLGMKRVERGQTLAEQGISGRVVLAVSKF
jgi:hypothetical protein